LVVIQDAKVQWRQTLPAQSFTPPLVAGQRIFVLTADRSVLAYDGATGQKLWTQQRPGEPLVLKQAGVLAAFKNTLLVGLSGRLAGLDPTNGVIVWESAIATPRGTNDMERLLTVWAMSYVRAHSKRKWVVSMHKKAKAYGPALRLAIKA
jgi:outer membrane protein assembly factor BamB